MHRMSMYADGGVIGKVSNAIERASRAAGTERGKQLDAADEALKNPGDKLETYSRRIERLRRADDTDDKAARFDTSNMRRVDREVEKAERGYANGGKVKKVMGEFKSGHLHSGSKSGPVVTDRGQAIAIALAEKRRQEQGQYSDGGRVDPKGLSAAARNRFSKHCRGQKA